MLTLLLSARLAVAEDPPEPPPRDDAPPAPAAPVPAEASTPAGSAAPLEGAAASATSPAAATPAPDARARGRFRTGRILANVGVAALPVGAGASSIAFSNSLQSWAGNEPAVPLPDIVETGALFGGVAAMVSSFPLMLTGVHLERRALLASGCTPRGQRWRHAPLALLALGGLATTVSNGEPILPLGAASWATVAVQHVRLQKDARDCKLRE